MIEGSAGSEHTPRVASSTPHDPMGDKTTTVAEVGRGGLDTLPAQQDGAIVASTDTVTPEAQFTSPAVTGQLSAGRWRITRVRAMPALLWSLFSAVVLALVVFGVMALAVVLVDKVGVLAAVNSLMGEAMQLSVGKLITLSAFASIALGLAVAAFKFFKLMLLNVSATLLGPLEVTLEPADK